MRSPSLNELPAPSPGKTGWPWTEESERLPATMPDGSPWPKISIVTPSYGQGQFIEETIRAVLLQGYPDIEFIIIDGGSQDNTVELIKKYEPFIAYWVSEKDSGQANAINKGFARATGQIYYWINSDAYPEKGVFTLAIKRFQENTGVNVLYGDCYYIDANGQSKGKYNTSEFSLENLVETDFIAQPTVFFTGKTWLELGRARETLRCAMDYELWLRWALKGVEFKFCPEIVAYYRLHENSKTVSLLRTSQNESFRLLLELKDTHQLNSKLQQNIPKAIYGFCRYSYWQLDLHQFWYYLYQYIKFTKRPPDFFLMRKALMALFGIRINRTAFKILKLIGR